MTDHRTARPRAAWWAVAATLVLVMSACGSGEDATASNGSPSTTAPPSATTKPLPTPVQELNFDSTEYTFEITPDPGGGLKPGWTQVNFTNVGDEPHQVMFARIKDGVDMSELAAAGAGDSSGAGAIEFVDMIGGVSYIGPGQKTTALVNLSEGIVIAMCYVPDSKGVAHALMGMTNTLTVEAPGAGDEPAAAEPSNEQVVGSIEFGEDGYQFPDELPAGWYHVTNTDTALHELSLLHLSEAVTEEDAPALVDQLANNETPSVDLAATGGMGAISPGFDGYLYLDLEPGTYMAVDFMPDPGNPRPHMSDGYYALFTV